MLQLDDLSKHYGDVAALDGLSLVARPGRLLGFLGPNGAGKTTAMRSIFGLVRLDGGTVRWNGAAITAEDRLRFGYMPEQRGLYPKMPVSAQLRYLARLHGLETTAATHAATEWLDRLGLAERADDALQALSHGNQQRIQLAAALVHEPDLLVLDEPFNGLDPIGVEAMSAVLRDRAAAGATVLFSSHQLDLVEELCDDVLIIAAGRDRTSGTLEEVRAAATHRRVEVRLSGGAFVPPEGTEVTSERDGLHRLRVAADTDPQQLLADFAAQGTVEQYTFQPPTLSEIFREAVGISLDALERERAAEIEEVPA